MKYTHLTRILSASLLLLACGSSDKTEPQGSGVDPAKTLDRITDADYITMCEYNHSETSQVAFQRLLCAFDSYENMDCQTAYDACIAMPAPPLDADQCVTKFDLSEIGSCATRITVAEMESCSLAIRVAEESFTFSCDMTQQEYNAALNPPRPTQCQDIKDKCPDLDAYFYFGEDPSDN